MAALATYNDLVAEVQDWLFGRTDIVAKIDTLIRLTEAKASRLLECRQMETRATAQVNLVATEPEYIALPADYATMRRVRVTDVEGKPALRYLTPVQMADKWEELGETAGTPIWFTVIGDDMQLCPVPNTANTLEMVYRATVPTLSLTNQTNWLLQQAPDYYLYGVLMEAAPYLHDDERIATWSQGLASIVKQLNDQSERALYNAGPLTMRRRGRSY